VEPVTAVAVDLDALGDTGGLWADFLAHAARRFGPIAPLDPAALPADRAAAAAELDRWAAGGVGDWRGALRRYAEDHGPVHLRPDGEATNALRRLERAGTRIGVYTDAPRELADVALAHLGAARRVEVVEAGAGSRERLVARLGTEAAVASSRAELLELAAG
jgi:phosphoglycolate phosphatase-like HAD superfamily hydrolase